MSHLLLSYQSMRNFKNMIMAQALKSRIQTLGTNKHVILSLMHYHMADEVGLWITLKLLQVLDVCLVCMYLMWNEFSYFYFEGLKNYNKQGIAFLNIAYPDNANFILSSLLHSIQSVEVGPFSRDLSCQFDNASNNKCNVAIGFFGYLISEGVFYNVRTLS